MALFCFGYKKKIEEVKRLLEEGDYVAAALTADEVPLRKVKFAHQLNILGRAYKKNEEFVQARDIFQRSYDQHCSKNVLLDIMDCCLEIRDFEGVELYFNEYHKVAPEDKVTQYMYRYKIEKKKERDSKLLIPILEELKALQYTEEYAFELAKQYHNAERAEECMVECEDIILWFGFGPTVERAKGLLAYYKGEISIEEIQRAGARYQEELERQLAEERARTIQEVFQPYETRLHKSRKIEYKKEIKEEPELKTLGFNTPEFKKPEFKVPEFKVPEFETPEFKIPEEQMEEERTKQRTEENIEERTKQREEEKIEEEDWLSESFFFQMAQQMQEEAETEAAYIAEAAYTTEEVPYGEIKEEPELNTSGFNTPEFKMPELKVPEFKMPEFKAPEFKTPEERMEEERTGKIETERTRQRAEEDIEERIRWGAEENIEERTKQREEENIEERNGRGAEERIEEEDWLSESFFLQMAQQLQEEATTTNHTKLQALLETYPNALKENLRNFGKIERLYQQASECLERVLEDREHPYFIVTGDGKTGKTTLAFSMIRLLYETGLIKYDRTAILDAVQLNQVSIEDYGEELRGCNLLIENAGGMTRESIDGLLRFYNECQGKNCVFLEDTVRDINKLLKVREDVRELFDKRIDIGKYSSNDLMVFVRTEFEKEEYSMEPEAEALLLERLEGIVRECNNEYRLVRARKTAELILGRAEKRTSAVIMEMAMQGKIQPGDYFTITAEDVML